MRVRAESSGREFRRRVRQRVPSESSGMQRVPAESSGGELVFALALVLALALAMVLVLIIPGTGTDNTWH